MGFLHWFRKPPVGRVEPRLEFVGEQDGENERTLKAQLQPLFERADHIQRAYLARAGFQPADAISVVLCLVSARGDDLELLQHVDEVFRGFAPPNVFLDVAFLTEVQEPDVARVCTPFYRRVS